MRNENNQGDAAREDAKRKIEANLEAARLLSTRLLAENSKHLKELQEVRRERDKVRQEREKARREREKARRERDKAHRECVGLREELAHLRANTKPEEGRPESVEKLVPAAQTASFELAETKCQLQAALEELKESRLRVSSFRTEKQPTELISTRTRPADSCAQSEIARLTETLSDVSTTIDKLEYDKQKCHAHIQSLSQKIQKLTAEQEGLQSEICRLVDELLAAHRELKTRQSNNEALEKLNEGLRNDSDELQCEMGRLVDEHAESRRELAAQKGHNKILQTQCEQLSTKLTELQSDMDGLQSEMLGLVAEREEARLEIEALKRASQHTERGYTCAGKR